ncbi:hypothetical protein MRX96_013090 [Rhipicephalus microplus]
MFLSASLCPNTRNSKNRAQTRLCVSKRAALGAMHLTESDERALAGESVDPLCVTIVRTMALRDTAAAQDALEDQRRVTASRVLQDALYATKECGRLSITVHDAALALDERSAPS